MFRDNQPGEYLFALVIAFALAYVIASFGGCRCRGHRHKKGGGRAPYRSGFYDGFSPEKLKAALFERGWRVYTVPSCGWSRDQLRLLDGYQGNVVCNDCDFENFPTWYNTNSNRVIEGYLPIDALSRLAWD